MRIFILICILYDCTVAAGRLGRNLRSVATVLLPPSLSRSQSCPSPSSNPRPHRLPSPGRSSLSNPNHGRRNTVPQQPNQITRPPPLSPSALTADRRRGAALVVALHRPPLPARRPPSSSRRTVRSSPRSATGCVALPPRASLLGRANLPEQPSADKNPDTLLL